MIKAFDAIPGVRITALCDVDRDILKKHGEQRRKIGQPVSATPDFRRLLDRRDLDGIVIATPDHWHALMTVWACQAGKDVYVEKPVSHTIWEGRRIVTAARKYKRIVQCGTQNRSDIGFQEAVRYLERGELGSIKFAWIINYVRRESIGKVDGPQVVSPSVDYNLFMGPAELVPLRRKNLHYDWHWIWPTGTGECGNRGVHAFDHTRWLIGETRLPTCVQTIASRLGWNDDGETPNTQITLFDGLKVPIIYELRNLPRKKGARKVDKFRGRGTTMFIECEKGYVVGGRGFMQVFGYDQKLIRKFDCDAGRQHTSNFITAMRSRRHGDLHADIEVGHISSAYCHLANISFRAGHVRSPAEIAQAAEVSPQFANSFRRLGEHLHANEIDLGNNPLTLGPRLTFDPTAETFTGDASTWANMYLRRTYRRPFVMPEEV